MNVNGQWRMEAMPAQPVDPEMAALVAKIEHLRTLRPRAVAVVAELVDVVIDNIEGARPGGTLSRHCGWSRSGESDTAGTSVDRHAGDRGSRLKASWSGGEWAERR